MMRQIIHVEEFQVYGDTLPQGGGALLSPQ